ncbi:alpha/beta fold hydrolase [Mycolicibacterium fluoranthenivorans]|uniref:alpha/beta fold hydrolase n=1 Tax=Mycolicibacterium fluoranthenivorans TaxID=258505 RepID=UPI003908A9DD
MADQAELAADLREIDTAAGTLRHYDVGDGPPVLFLHGSGPGVTGWRNFRGVLPAFARYHRCLVLEFPGFGVSDDWGGHPMVTAQGAVVPFLDALGIDRIDIIGNSISSTSPWKSNASRKPSRPRPDANGRGLTGEISRRGSPACEYCFPPEITRQPGRGHAPRPGIGTVVRIRAAIHDDHTAADEVGGIGQHERHPGALASIHRLTWCNSSVGMRKVPSELG